MWSLMLASAGAATITVGDGDNMARACLQAQDNDVIEVVAGRLGVASVNHCDLSAVDGLTIRGSGGMGEVAGLRALGSTNLTLQDIELTQYKGSGYALWGFEADGLTLQTVEIAESTEFGVLLSDSDAVQIYALSSSESGAPQDTLLSIAVLPSAPPLSV